MVVTVAWEGKSSQMIPMYFLCVILCMCLLSESTSAILEKMQTNGGYELCCIFTSLEEKRWKCGCLFSPFFCFAAFDECTIGFRLLFYADMYILQ